VNLHRLTHTRWRSARHNRLRARERRSQAGAKQSSWQISISYPDGRQLHAPVASNHHVSATMTAAIDRWEIEN
jgi:hypothetical protein